MEIEKFCKRVISGEFQDEENPKEASKLFGTVVIESLKQPQDSLVVLSHQALLKAITFPEYKQCSFCKGGIQNIQEQISITLSRAQVVDSEIEISGLLCFILRAYTFDSQPTEKIEILKLLSRALGGGGFRNSSTPSISLLKLTLESLTAILNLTPVTLENSHFAKTLLDQKLLPLHLVQGKISPSQSVLSGFHRELTLCVCKACELANSPQAWEDVFCYLSGSGYPSISEGNSQKEVLFLHELERLILECKTPLTGKSRSSIVTRLLSCISSLHAVVCERALSFWKSDQVLKSIQGSDMLLTKTCERTLAKTSLEHWSSTVKSMAGAALLRSGISTSSSSSSSDTIVKAIEKAKENEILMLNPLPIITMPLPKTFSSTSVIRDATEPFAVGAFGVMWKGRAIIPGTSKQQWPLVALKELDDVDAAKKEIDSMSRIGSHFNLISLLGVFELKKGSVLSLVLDFIDGPGDLHTVILERGSLISLELCKFFVGQIGNGLKYIHEKGFVYGDMKPENILITSNGYVKICDFGSSFPISSSPQMVVGTVEYMAPEQVSSVLADWWAFGCVIHFILTGRPPVFFDKEDDADLSEAFTRAVTFADQKGGILVKDLQARQLISSLCSRNPSERPIDGGESMDFFKNFKPWNSLQSKTPIPKLPTEKVNKTQLEKNSGPWQRRTFSTIYSPLPVQYANIDSSLINSFVGGINILPNSQLCDWSSNNIHEEVFENSINSIPKTRVKSILASNNNNNNTGSKRARRVQTNYNVAGVDLTAG